MVVPKPQYAHLGEKVQKKPAEKIVKKEENAKI